MNMEVTKATHDINQKHLDDEYLGLLTVYDEVIYFVNVLVKKCTMTGCCNII